MRATRKIMSDIHGHLDPATVDDKEVAVIIENDARVGLLKLLGQASYQSLLNIGLAPEEIDAVGRFRNRLD